jgi:thioredoxin 1
MAAVRPVEVSDDTFEQEVLQSNVPVLVDFWAEWCGPCKMVSPLVDRLAEEFDGKLKVAKVNVDDNQALPARYGVRGIPTLMLFKDGDVTATKVGAVSKSHLDEFVRPHVS